MADKLQVRTVRLELLRSGPPHNQLLSPLTPYLGISGDSPAGVVHVPYEHADFERRLADLRYTGLSDDRLSNLRKTGIDVARMLAAVPGLSGSVSAESDSLVSMIHLRVTLSASELALLPFELSKVPTTTDGESEAWLALQTSPPVCITRHIRTVTVEGVTWPARARILFIAGPTNDIPFDAHRRALEQAIAPFCYPRRDDPTEGIDARHTHYGELMTIIENASLDDVVTACKDVHYTHIHVLAHGAVDFSSKGRPFGLRLRGRNGGSDIVSGERFSTALRRVDAAGVHRPFVVTLASCDSGLVANVIEPAPGASFAHTLHQSGIPLVIGSQFPLTKEGSITVVERFYGGLLRGDNPHVLAHQTRSELHARYGADTHDWASLVVYEALPTNMAAQLEHVCYRQGKLCLDAALERIDLAVQDAIDKKVMSADYEQLETQVRAATDALPLDGTYAIECRGLRASAMKRLAQATYRYALTSDDMEDQVGRSCDRLEEALSTYKVASEMFLRNDTLAVQRAATLHWVLVQQLSLQAVLRQPLSHERWATARLAATLYLDHPSLEERAWAHASLAELCLIQLSTATEQSADYADQVRENLEQLVSILPADQRFPISSTRKQFQRYVDWWGAPGFEQQVANRRTSRGEWTPWTGADRLIAAAEDAVGLLRATLQRDERRIVRRKKAAELPEHTSASTTAASAAAETLGTRTTARRARATVRDTAFLEIHMLPAQFGDCLWIEYGTDPRRTSRVLVDCGPPGTTSRLLSKIESLPQSERAVELFILSHIDDDHIGGAVPFLQAEMGGLRIDEVWFNGYKHLGGFLSAEQGEQFSTLIEARGLAWNTRTGGDAIVIRNTLPAFELPGGMRVTLLSPTGDKLEALKARWEDELARKGMEPGAPVGDLLAGDPHAQSTDVEALAALPFKSDAAPANGSSIAVLAEFEGKSVLLAADAHPPVLEASIRQLLECRGLERLPVSAFKVSHHGSHSNTSPELLSLLECSRYLLSTNGQKFDHPHRVTISRIIKGGGPRPTLLFNYFVKDKNDVWARPALQERFGYMTTYPEASQGLVIKL
jgi:hypothetical protein